MVNLLSLSHLRSSAPDWSGQEPPKRSGRISVNSLIDEVLHLSLQKENFPQDANKDQEGASQGIFFIGEKKSRKPTPCQRKEAFGSYGEPLLLSAASVLSMAVFSKLIIHPNSAFV
jgi:hypothetical protein